MFALKDLMSALGSTNLDCRQDGAKLDATRREFYLFNSTIAGIDIADAVLMIGANPRREAPIINARLRKRWLSKAGRLPVGVIGDAHDLTYDVEHLGPSPSLVAGFRENAASFAERMAAAERPMIILGQGALARSDGAAILAAAWSLASELGALTSDWHGFNVLHTAASRVGALDLGFLPGANGLDVAGMMGGAVDLLWLLGADEFDMGRIGTGTFVVYQGHHGDRGAARADVVLPGAAYTEKDGTYVNTEGRVQRGYRAVFPPGDAREDWRILRAFSATIGHALPYDDLDTLRTRLVRTNPVFARTGLARFGASQLTGPVKPDRVDMIADQHFASPVMDYYLTNPISRASATMAECSRLAPPALAAGSLAMAAE